MRSTLEIIVAVKESQPVTEEELKLALMAMSSINHFVEDELRALAESVKEGKPSAKVRTDFALQTLDRMFYARKKSPEEWLGRDNIPGTPEHTKRLRGAKALYKAATGETL